MTIYFDGHTFKYEIEGVCKLFFPLVKFSHIFSAPSQGSREDCVITALSKETEKTHLSVKVIYDKKEYFKEQWLDNKLADYDTECERFFCVMLYGILHTITGIKPKWGILTGVRPVAMLQRERREGKTEEQIDHFFKEQYLVSDEKLRLAKQTAQAQNRILESLPARSYSLYIAIPFCNGRCSYCSFVSHSITTKKATEKIDEYIALLQKELVYTAALAKEVNLTIDTIYIGGGTPTSITAAQLEKIMETVKMNFPIEAAREYTVEAGRADSITEEKLAVIKKYGATRVSVNPQTFNDSVLKKIGRRHTAAEAIEAYQLARKVGFNNINMDFIAGLPGDTMESFQQTIDKAVALAPENITVHTLSIKRSADLFSEDWIQDYAKTNITAEMTDYAQKKILSAGYNPYYLYRQKNTIGNLENVGFAKEGTESIYNVYIMDEIQTILACGASGVTKLVAKGGRPINRIFNFKYHFEYIDRFAEIISRKDEVRKFDKEQEL